MGFSALIAAVGMVNNISLSVLQRTRELGLLRALGFTARQVREMILAESAQLTIAATLVGLVLGTFYGWAGAQSLLGSITGSPGLVLPSVPVGLLAILAGAVAVLTLVASVAPSRRATRVVPVAALAVQQHDIVGSGHSSRPANRRTSLKGLTVRPSGPFPRPVTCS